MCVSDLGLGRLMSVQSQAWAITGSVGLVFPPSRQRVLLVVAPTVILSTAQGYTITFSDGTAITMSGLEPILRLSLAEDGPLLQLGGTISSATATATGTVIMTTLPEDYIAYSLDKFLSPMSGKPGY